MPSLHDENFLRDAIALAEQSVAEGARPFGAVVVDGGGKVVARAKAVAPVDPRDWTAHSEVQALRTASAALSWDELAKATIYAASPAPCARGRSIGATSAA
jgi:tRNA(Arg) A34 adenosine deaminase TadA